MMRKDKVPGILIVTIVLIGIIDTSCTKDTVDKNNCALSGNVIGYEANKCGCCPGWLVALGNDTLKFEIVPDNNALWDMVNFFGYPVPIKFNYTDDTGACSDVYKIMTCIDISMDTDCSKSGEIIEYDWTECLCCPGWIIKTGEDTIKVLKLPNESQVRAIAETSGFPIAIDLDYFNDTGYCADSYKKITCIRLK